MGKIILAVDDSPTMLASLQGMLERAGHKVTKAQSAEDALDILQRGFKPNLIITDYHMGGMNGVDLVAAVRKLPGFNFVPILLVTTESQQDKRTAAKVAGATGWLVKPVQPDVLVQVIKQVVPGA
jgi:two-component system, chemotaxis family, chemotaxis protein CheY